MRINKYIALCGVTSRRGADELLASGRVFINDLVVTDLGRTVGDEDRVEIDGKVIAPIGRHIYIAFNKPRGTITTASDERGRETVIESLLKARGAEILLGVRLFPVGRLDYETEGLLVLTTDGDWANKISHPASKMPKTYVATLGSSFDRRHIHALENGIDIDGDGRMTLPAHAKMISHNKVQITITEGRNRQVRKMFASLGYKIAHLERITVGNLKLQNLRRGEFRYISPDEIE